MTDKNSPFLSRLDAVAADIEVLLDRLLAATPEQGELSRPARLIEAMRYSSLNGGKRFRPFLVVESAALFEVPRPNALMAGAALECVHCYSLVHDDLPAMDNDDLRRGQPTAHKKFDEATAILAGDGLLTFAFDILSRQETHADPRVRIELVMALARASGVGGMAGGQMLDLAAEGRFVQNRAALEFSEKDVRTLQAMKTGALLRFACQAGGILAAATPAQRAALEWLCAVGAVITVTLVAVHDGLLIGGGNFCIGRRWQVLPHGSNLKAPSQVFPRRPQPARRSGLIDPCAGRS
jgi:farnesyl diphosphate synthase